MEDNEKRKLLAKFSSARRVTADKVMTRLEEELAKGVNVSEAVKNIRKEYPDFFRLPQVNDIVVNSAIQGYGISAGLVVAEGKEAILKKLSSSWDASGLTLSQKLHGADTQMYKVIVNTLETQIRANKSVVEIARSLYDGYNYDKVINTQDLPKYLNAFRHALTDDADTLSLARQTAERISALSRNGAPNQALAAAYKQLLETATTGTEKALKNAVYVAVNEKSRYVAERIARTEATKAWADGFFAKTLQDKHVVGFKWVIGSRHPVYDICDMYAKADMFNLGAGIYPKDRVPPLPAHPHCLCHIAEVYKGEVDLSNQQDNTDESVNQWLKGLTENQSRQVLGFKGTQEWQSGSGWQDYLRGWQGLGSPVSRLDAAFVRGLMEKNLFQPDDSFLSDIAKSQGLSYTLGKEGYARFLSDNGKALYPLNNGFVDIPIKETLRKGSVIVDRYGDSSGSFVSPKGTSLAERSLPIESRKDTYHTYRIKADIENVLSGRTASWFDQAGGGWQYKLPDRVVNLSEYLEEVD
jgi:hypothetical protein